MDCHLSIIHRQKENNQTREKNIKAFGKYFLVTSSLKFFSQAVDNPTSVEIHDVLAASGFNPLLERNKCYPREGDREPDVQGRVRVQLKNDDGSAKHSQKTSM